MRDERLGRLASRTLAILLGLHALDLLRGLLSFRFIGAALTPAGWVVGSFVEGILVLGLAVWMWLRADAVGAWLLGKPRRSPGRAARVEADVETTVLRAVGFWIVLVALPGIVYWAIVIATPSQTRIPPDPAAYMGEAVAEAALGAIAFLAAPRLTARLRRRSQSQA